MGLAIVGVGLMPILDVKNFSNWRQRNPILRPCHKVGFWLWVTTFVLLGWLGAMPVEFPYDTLSRIICSLYFFYILVFVVVSDDIDWFLNIKYSA